MATTVAIPLNYPSEFQRANITAPDPDASALPPAWVAMSKGFRLGATCAQPNATLSLWLYLLDSQGRVISVMSISFNTGPVADWGATYVGKPSVEPWWPTLGACALVPKADFVTPNTTWSIAGTRGDF